MKPTHTYASEKFSGAVRTLAIGVEPLQTRLRDAFLHHVARLQADDLPPDLRARFVKLRTRMTAVEDPTEGSIDASARAMSDESAQELAGLIVELAADLERRFWQAHPQINASE